MTYHWCQHCYGLGSVLSAPTRETIQCPKCRGVGTRPSRTHDALVGTMAFLTGLLLIELVAWFVTEVR